MRFGQIEAMAMGTPTGGYPGAFGHVLEKFLREYCSGQKTLHLFSGSSTIGDVRVDFRHPNATHNQDVFEFLAANDEVWDVVLLDPPYEKTSRLCEYVESPLSNNVPARRKFAEWAAIHAKKIIWLDICAPIFEPFERERTYLILPGGYRRTRTLSILRKLEPSTAKGDPNGKSS